MKIRVEYIGPTLNKIYAGVHWKKRKDDKEAAHWAVASAVSGCSRVTKPVQLVYQPYIRGRAFDVDNYSFTCKMICDGLVRWGILPDDTNKWVRSITILAPIKIKKPEQSYMEVFINQEW